MNKTRKVGLAKRRKRIAEIHAGEKHPPVPQKGPRAARTATGTPIATLALKPRPRR